MAYTIKQPCGKEHAYCRECSSSIRRRGPSAVNNVRLMLPIEQAWIGAMIEAEGSVAFPSTKRNGFKINLTNADPEVLSAFLRVTGAGSLYRVPLGNLGKKPCYRWQIQGLLEVKTIVKQCAPYSMKLQRIKAYLGSL